MEQHKSFKSLNRWLAWGMAITLLVAMPWAVAKARYRGPQPLNTGESAGAARGLEPPPKGGKLIVEWLTLHDFEELATQADLIVYGRVVSQKSELRRSYPYDHEKQRELTPEEAGEVYGELPFTSSRILVEEVVSNRGAASPGGRLVTPQSELDIVEVGGFWRGGLVEPQDVPLLQVGQEYVFFLFPRKTPEEQVIPGSFVIAGGYQGRFEVRKDLVHPSAKASQSASFSRYDNVFLSDFRDDIREILSAKRKPAQK